MWTHRLTASRPPPWSPRMLTRRSAQRAPVPVQNVASSRLSPIAGKRGTATAVRRTTQPSSPSWASSVSSLETSWR